MRALIALFFVGTVSAADRQLVDFLSEPQKAPASTCPVPAGVAMVADPVAVWGYDLPAKIRAFTPAQCEAYWAAQQERRKERQLDNIEQQVTELNAKIQ